MRSLLPVVIECSGGAGSPPTLTLDGPVQVRVDALGPVQAGPAAMLSTGEPAAGATLEASPDRVARVEDGTVVAVGPGEAEVTVKWGEQTASWTLVVEPSLALLLVDVPATIPVGRPIPLHVTARLDGENVDPGALVWKSSDPAIATVADGLVTGVAPGVVYVSVTSGRNEAWAELQVQ